MGTGSRAFRKAKTQRGPPLCCKHGQDRVQRLCLAHTVKTQGDVATHRYGHALAPPKTHSDLHEEESSIPAVSWA